MMAPGRFLGSSAAFAFLLLLVIAPTVEAQAGTVSGANQAIQQAFASVQIAEKMGGNVTSLVFQLNQAVGLVARGGATSNLTEAATLFGEATQIANSVSASAPQVALNGAQATRLAQDTTVGEIVAFIVAGVLVYLYLPRLFWRLWLRSHRDWKVSPR